MSLLQRFAVAALAVLLTVPVVLLSGCGGGGGSSGKPVAVATIFAYYDILRAVGGDKIDAVILLPPRTTPHEFDPSVRAKSQVSRARLIVKNGLGLDDWIDKLAAGNRSATILAIAKAVGAKPLETEETSLDATTGTVPAAKHDEHEHALGNPHIWLDPTIQMAATEKVRDALVQMDPANKDYYSQRAEAYLKDLQALDADFKAAVATFKTKEFIGFHAAYDYLAHRYGLKQIAALEEYPEQGITPAQAQRVIQLIKDKHIKVVFTESALPSKDADLIVRQTGVKLAVLQPLETYDSLSDTYVSLMRQNLQNLKEALGP